MDDIEELSKIKVEACVVGKAIYEDHISIEEIKNWNLESLMSYIIAPRLKQNRHCEVRSNLQTLHRCLACEEIASYLTMTLLRNIQNEINSPRC
jgi:hypothetical protein